MATVRVPKVQVPEIRSGDESAIFEALLALAWSWLRAGGFDVAHAPSRSDVAKLGGTSVAGLVAAGSDLVALLGESPQGRKALRDLGFQEIFQNFESHRG